MVTFQTPDSQKDESVQRDGQQHINFAKEESCNSEIIQTPRDTGIDRVDSECSMALTHSMKIDDSASLHYDNVDAKSIRDVGITIVDSEDDEIDVENEIALEEVKLEDFVNRIQHETPDGQITPSFNDSTFGEICITNSTNVRVGNTTLYKGPVTIKQFLYTNSNTSNDSNGITQSNQIHSDICDNISNIQGDSNEIPANKKFNKVKDWLWTWRCVSILCVLGLITATILIIIKIEVPSNPTLLGHLSPGIDPNDIFTENVQFVQRTEWGAQPPEEPLVKLSVSPVPYVIISHTASEGCYTHPECVQRVRLAQTMHIEGKNWSDIAYNFLIGGDGLVYIGRGWDFTGAHTFGFNIKSIGISLIGTFNGIEPPARQLHSLKKLIDIGVEKEKIQSNYILLGHRQVAVTLSPGEMLYRIIQKWDHWAEKP